MELKNLIILVFVIGIILAFWKLTSTNFKKNLLIFLIIGLIFFATFIFLKKTLPINSGGE